MAGAARRGPKPKLSTPVLAELFGNLRAGHGRHMACQLVGVSYTTLRNRFREDPGVLAEVVAIERSRAEDCLRVAFELRNHDDPNTRLKAVNTYLAQDAKVLEARRAVAAARRGPADPRPMARFLPKLADIFMEFVPEDRMDEALACLEAVSMEATAPTPGSSEVPRRG